MRIRSRRGSFSVFVSIMISSAVFMLGSIACASAASSRALIVRSALMLERDLILSRYSEKLEDRYGVYAALPDSGLMEAFRVMTFGIPGIRDPEAAGVSELSGASLQEGILRFTRPRFPVQASVQLIDRLNGFRALFGETAEEAGRAAALPDPRDEEAAGGMYRFDDILELLKGLSPESALSAGTEDAADACRSLDEIHRLLADYESPAPFESPFSGEIRSGLSISETTMNGISGFAGRLFSIGSDPVYDRIALEYYIDNMFSCAVNFRICDSVTKYREDMRGRSFERLSPSSAPEMERILFGCAEDSRNLFFAKTAVCSIRFVSNLIANLTDTVKREEIKALAAAACLFLAAATDGAAAVPPETAEAVILVLESASQASGDFDSLMRGESVRLLPARRFPSIETWYSDYIDLLLLAVPREAKLSRIETIMKANSSCAGTNLFTSIRVSCLYGGRRLSCEGGYFSDADS